MKRIICFLLICLTPVLISACTNKKTDTNSRPTIETEASGVDIIKYIKKGTMPEINYSLGDDVKKIEAEIIKEDSQSDQIMKKDKYTTIITADGVNLVYETEKADEGIKYIVGFEQSFGFETGTDSNTVNEVMKTKGYDAPLKAIPQELTVFVPASGECECLSYLISGKSLNFVFDNNYLAATIIYEKGK